MTEAVEPRFTPNVRGEPVTTRGYLERDEAEVLELLSMSLGPGPVGRRAPEFFRWKHLENPFGPSLLLLAESAGRIVGLRAFMRWGFRVGDRSVRAVRAVDTATHPDHRGTGIFSRLTEQALQEVRGGAELVFNTPNDQSRPGYLKMGWRTVGRIPVAIRIRRPVAVLRDARRFRSSAAAPRPARPRPRLDAETAAEALADPQLPQLLGDAAGASPARLATPRDAAFLDWRYGSAPLLDYRGVREHIGGMLAGIALFRMRKRGRLWESTVADVIVRPGDVRTAGRLLRRVAAAATVDHVACSFPPASEPARAARPSGFVRSPGGPTLTAKSVRGDLRPDPYERRSWALCLGDLEVF
jgi:GNAT superfamily N-acetyltransferase